MATETFSPSEHSSSSNHKATTLVQLKDDSAKVSSSEETEMKGEVRGASGLTMAAYIEKMGFTMDDSGLQGEEIFSSEDEETDEYDPEFPALPPTTTTAGIQAQSTLEKCWRLCCYIMHLLFVSSPRYCVV